MAAPKIGPCEDWTTPEEILACGNFGKAPSLDKLVAAAAHSSQVLFGLSGRQYPGACLQRQRPCFGDNGGCGSANWRPGSMWWWGSYPSIPERVSGHWVNFGRCAGQCALDCLRLAGPVADIIEVLIDGQVLSPDAYRVRGHRTLCRIDGGTWPCTQRLGAKPSKPGTFRITNTRGKPITANMRAYASMIGAEFTLAICNDASCLPSNVEQVVRDGTTISFEDADELFPNGKTGLEHVDAWIKTVNPKGIQRRATVVRADDPRVVARYT